MIGRFDRTTFIGVVTIVVSVGLCVIIFSGSIASIIGGGSDRQIVAQFASTGQLRPGDDVRIGGIRVGSVASIDVAADGRSSLVRMDIDDPGGALYRDARATLRWRTLLGQAFYVALERGAKASGDLGEDVIPKARTTTQVELDDIASVVAGPAREGLRNLPPAVADGLSDAEGIAGTLDALQRVSPALERSAEALQGTVPSLDLRRLVDGTAQVVDELAQDPAGLRGIVQEGAVTVRTTASRAAAIREALELAPGTLRDIRETVLRLRRTVDLAGPLVADLHDAAPQIRTTFAHLRPTVASADRLLTAAKPLLRDLDPTARSLAGVAHHGVPVVRSLTPTIERLRHTIIPGIARKWPETGISTTVMIGAALAGLGGIAAQRDANGHFVRFPLTGGSGSAYLPCQAFPNNPDFTPEQQLQCQSLSETIEQVLSYKPKGKR